MGQLKRPNASKLSTILMFHFLHGPLEKGIEENHVALTFLKTWHAYFISSNTII